MQNIDQESQCWNGLGVLFQQPSKFGLGTGKIPGLGEPLGELTGRGRTGLGVPRIDLGNQFDRPREILAGGHDLRSDEKCRSGVRLFDQEHFADSPCFVELVLT